MFVSQRAPVKPVGQSHEKLATPSLQKPPFAQGFGVQSSRFVSQSVPPQPARQRHEKLATPSTQLAPF